MNGSALKVKISDSGPGLPKEAQDAKTRYFYSNRTPGYTGTGVGLTTAYKYVKLLSGSISFTSGNGGTSYEITIPLQTKEIEKDEVSNSMTNEYPSLSGKRILIIEDDTILFNTYRRQLDKYKAITVHVLSIDHIGNQPKGTPALIIQDWHTLGLSGEEGYLYLQKTFPGVPILVITANDVEAASAQRVKIPQSHILLKPFNIQVFTNKVKSLLDSERS